MPGRSAPSTSTQVTTLRWSNLLSWWCAWPRSYNDGTALYAIRVCACAITPVAFIFSHRTPAWLACSPEKPLPEEKAVELAWASAEQELMNLPFQVLLPAAAFAIASALEKAAPLPPEDNALASAEAAATQSLRLGRLPLPFLKLSTKALAVASAEVEEPAGQGMTGITSKCVIGKWCSSVIFFKESFVGLKTPAGLGLTV